MQDLFPGAGLAGAYPRSEKGELVIRRVLALPRKLGRTSLDKSYKVLDLCIKNGG